MNEYDARRERVSVALENIALHERYSHNELESIGLMDSKLIHPNNGVLYDSLGRVLGASIVYAFKKEYGLTLRNDESHLDLFLLASIIGADKVFQKVQENPSLTTKVSVGNTKLSMVPLESLVHFKDLFSQSNEVETSHSYKAIEEILKDVKISVPLHQMQYLSDHRYEPDATIGSSIQIPPPVVRAIKYKMGFIKLDNMELNSLAKDLWELKNSGQESLTAEDKGKLTQQYPYKPDHKIVESLRKNVDAIQKESAHLGLKKIKPNSDYTILEMMSLCKISYREISEAIDRKELRAKPNVNNGEYRKTRPLTHPRQLFEADEEEPESTNTHFGVYHITGYDLIDYMMRREEGNLSLRSAKKLTRNEEIRRIKQKLRGKIAELNLEDSLEVEEIVHEDQMIRGVPVYNSKGKLAKFSTTSVNLERTYFSEISATPLLTAKEEKELSIRIKNGDTVALNDLVEANLLLVASIARQYSYAKRLDFLDRVQEGSIGLMNAAYKFDGTKGFKFSTYATWWIRQKITRAMSDGDASVRLPWHVYEQHSRISKFYADYIDKNGEVPSVATVAKMTGMKERQIQKLRNMNFKAETSFDQFVGDGDTTFEELFTPEEDRFERHLTELSDKKLVGQLLSVLTPNEREIIERRFGVNRDDEETLQEIGDPRGITRERIRQIEVQALRKMRKKKDLVDPNYFDKKK